MQENRNLELLEIYMDLTEKQDDIIQKLSQIVKRQATEIRHLQNYNECIDDCEKEAEELIQEYQTEIKS